MRSFFQGFSTGSILFGIIFLVWAIIIKPLEANNFDHIYKLIESATYLIVGYIFLFFGITVKAINNR